MAMFNILDRNTSGTQIQTSPLLLENKQNFSLFSIDLKSKQTTWTNVWINVILIHGNHARLRVVITFYLATC